jgi:hypothetical protein
VQESGLNAAWIWIVTDDVSVAPQMVAACWKQLSRCWPMVTPGLPPTGAAGVGSLNPSPGPSRLMMVMVALANGRRRECGDERGRGECAE